MFKSLYQFYPMIVTTFANKFHVLSVTIITGQE